MAELEQQPAQTPQKQRRILRSVLLTFAIIMLFLVSALTVMVSTDRGSKFLLDRVMERQQIIQYQYEGGNLLNGIILKIFWSS